MLDKMNAHQEPEEGGPCPEAGCHGRLEFRPVEGCSCHISPPCGACVENPLTCSVCGWSTDELDDDKLPEEPFYIREIDRSSEPAERRNFFRIQADIAREKGATWMRCTVKEDGGACLFEAWKVRPEKEGDPRDPNDVRFVAHSLCDDTFTRCHSLSGAIGLLELTAARFDLRKIEHD